MKKYSEKTFRINDDYIVVCHCENTRYGFRHLASMKNKYYNEVAKSKACYYNRTWESFQYETVLSKVLDASGILSDEQKKECMERFRQKEYEEVNRTFGMISGIAKLGEILCNTQSEVNDWKERMIKAGLGDRGLIMPDDWHRLSEDEKERRLNGVINELSK